ncbi:MAG: hypothetical protein JST43_04905 [Bacteroidetes bacterium]|nr:hypothetical protein [Bacteroidota bacterium]MBS1539836.1 hypothetical protein [Bacteroidota bacterium]
MLLSIIVVRQGNKRFISILFLLVATLSVEILAGVGYWLHREFVWAYHLYSPIEYLFIATFVLTSTHNRTTKNLIAFSVLLYMLFSISLSVFVYHFLGMPGINIGVESLLIFSLCTYRLFNLEATDKPIFLVADFWICIGFLLFFGGCSFFFAVYTPLFKTSVISALSLFGTIAMPLNLLLYSLIIIGLLCLIPKRNSASQL